MKKITAIILALGVLCPVALGFMPKSAKKPKAEELVIGSEGSYDVVVYGATSAGVTAAIAAKREGADVLLISQNGHIGGLTSSGLGATDMANKNVVGGISWEFYNRIYEYYKNDAAWTSETSEDYFGLVSNGAIFGGKDDALKMQWVFEPKVAQQVFKDMLIDAGVPVVFNEPLELDGGVKTEDGRITSIESESGKTYEAKVFIDCSYEGDLMAEAGVEYTVGREANATYGETMNGILPNLNEYTAVSPYVVEGDPDSGLLPFIEDASLGAKGEGDGRVQAYCFRFTLSTDPNNRLPITKPENYHPEWYETRARLLQSNPKVGNELTQNRMPNNKTDTNHADFVGMSYEYANGDYLSRKNIADDHRDYVLGLLWFYAYDERVPLSVREEMRTYGLAKDEFLENGNFPIEIYLREGRRMVSDYVMKESDVIQNAVPGVIQKTTAPHSVGQGFYWFDSHRVAYYKVSSSLGDGYQTDGNFWSTRRDYPISYESIRPKKEQCENLFVPVCLSSTHAAYGSIRMETTYMIVGESAGTAAALCAREIESDPEFCVQELDYATLAATLSLNGQKLGDIVADDLSSGDLVVLKLNVLGLIDISDAQTLRAAVSDGFNNAERVGAVQKALVAAANRIVSGTGTDGALKVLNKYGIISNMSAWEKVFADPLPASLPVENVVSIFNKVADFFKNESPLGYISDWVKYFYEQDIIDGDTRGYFDDNAISGKTTDGAKTQALLIAIARTIDASVLSSDEALQVFINTKITGNSAVWEPVFRGESESVSGSSLNGLLKNVYSYLKNNEAKIFGKRIGVATLDFLLKKSLFAEEDYSELLKTTEDGKSADGMLVKGVIVAAAGYFNTNATETDALDVLQALGVSVEGVSGAMNGESVSGADWREFLLSLASVIRSTPVVEPLSSEITGYFVEHGILGETDCDYLSENAVSGRTVEFARLNVLLSRISTRLSVNGETSVEKLVEAGAIDADDANALNGSMVEGGAANAIIRKLHAYIEENNETLSAETLALLTGKNILSATEKETAEKVFSTFGYADPAFAQKTFLGLAAVIDPTATELSLALAVLKDINAIANAENWNGLLSGTASVSGQDCMSIVNWCCKFIGGVLADYAYLVEKAHITAETATYFIRHGNNSNTAAGSKIVELLIALAKPMDETATDGAKAVAALKENGIISNDAAWIAIVNDPTKDVTVQNLINLVEKAVDKLVQLELQAGGVAELSDAVLNWLVSQGYIVEGSYGKEYFRTNAKTGGTLNQGETRNLIIRAFRGISGKAGVTGSALNEAVSATDFTFSDDPTEDATLREYWYGLVLAKKAVDGEMLRVLLNRIYEYMNEVAA
ncbi:MAG: FAD-dependent oxidoreductase [Clostridia bacterium]|nr:FAD-dependent oxidoreductase [Clostridia bacterium]